MSDYYDSRGRDSLIHRYSCCGNLDGLNELIAQGADINEPRDGGNTPLHYASHLNIANALISAGAEVNQTDNVGDTPLHYASKTGFVSIVKALLANKAVASANTAGQTPIDVALDDSVKAAFAPSE